MSALVLKMISSIPLPGSFDAQAFSVSTPVRLRLPISEERRFFAVRILFFASIMCACIYLFFMVSMMIQGERLPERTRALRALEEERRVQYALLSAARSPEKVTETAMEQLQMVSVSGIKYIGNKESVATAMQAGSY